MKEEKCDKPFRCDCTINGRPCSQEIPDELLEQGEPPILVHQDPVVVDEEEVARIPLLDVAVDLGPLGCRTDPCRRCEAPRPGPPSRYDPVTTPS